MWLAALVVKEAVHVQKPWAGEARPPVVLDPAAFHLIGKALRSGSFPSGHTAAAFAIAGVVAMHLRRAWSTALLLVLASGVGLSRMAVGVHWPVDVLAGAAVGWASACGALVLARRWRWGISPRGRRVTLPYGRGRALAGGCAGRCGRRLGKCVWRARACAALALGDIAARPACDGAVIARRGWHHGVGLRHGLSRCGTDAAPARLALARRRDHGSRACGAQSVSGVRVASPQ